MKNNNSLIPKLYALISSELEKRQPYLTPRTLSEGDRQRQGLALTDVRCFVSVFENHIMEHTASVVFAIETSAEGYALRFYRPLHKKEYNRLAASGYAPVLRSKVYLSVGVGMCETVTYAYSEIRLSQYASLIDVFDALITLGKELEQFLMR